MNQSENYHSGVVAVVGPPNAGKSTLLNRYLQQKIAIVTPLPQTTRNRIQGIVTGKDWQMILLDTPGLHKAKETLNKEMMRIAMDALAEADVALFLADASDDSQRRERRRSEYCGWLEQVRCPSVLALNKIDMMSRDQLLPVIDWYRSLHPFNAIIPISALNGEGAELLLQELVSRLPEGPQYYPADIPTDATERFIAAELIREKIFLRTHQEVPYSTAVLIESFQEDEQAGQVVIHAVILVARDSQKGIIIGKNGAMLGDIRKAAVREIEKMLGCKVQLRLWVKVKKNWTENEQILRELGMQG
ncbi:MAG: GTP-binding protein Era [Candidatus Electronema aureum]|uniref:GTPase Era n=1 Tax=Candidatus Electronema aureum TaxID=2005002 RepID=A0A521G4H5_9BACT|nr:MAG: GTP-binding protein Era [Candidatus Electronema aureum]